VLQRALWAETDRKYKIAAEQWQSIKTATEVKADKPDKSADFSHETPHQYTEAEPAFSFDRKAAEQRARSYSAVFASHPEIREGTVEISGEIETRRFVNSEGSVIRISMALYRVMVNASTTAPDGMQIPLHLSYFAIHPESLPGDREVIAAIGRMSEQLVALRNAPAAELIPGLPFFPAAPAPCFFTRFLAIAWRARGKKIRTMPRLSTSNSTNGFFQGFSRSTQIPRRRASGRMTWWVFTDTTTRGLRDGA
jgi:hypothetical protein